MAYKMSKFEKRLCVFAIVFVVIYLGAISLTIQSRLAGGNRVTRLESAKPGPGEGPLMLAELFLPMIILLAISVSFIIVRKKRDKDEQKPEAIDKDAEET